MTRLLMAPTAARSALILFAFASGCGSANVRVERLPAYDCAMKMGGREEPVLVAPEGIDDSSVLLLGYALVSVSGGTNRRRAQKILALAREHLADVVVFTTGDPQYAGAVNIDWGSGISTSEAVYRHTSYGTYCRIPNARLGVITDENGLVLSLSEETRASGIQEGDTLLSASNIPWPRHERSALWQLYCQLQPGDSVKLVWTRPGIGRMEGVTTAIANEARRFMEEGSPR